MMLRCFTCGKETEKFHGWAFCGNGKDCPGTKPKEFSRDSDYYHNWRPLEEGERDESNQ